MDKNKKQPKIKKNEFSYKNNKSKQIDENDSNDFWKDCAVYKMYI